MRAEGNGTRGGVKRIYGRKREIEREREREREMELYGYSITARIYLSCFIVVGIAFSHVGKIKFFLLLL